MGGRITFFEYKEGAGGGGGIDSDTELMLHMDDVSLTDSSFNTYTTTANGNATRSTSDPKFGAGSLALDGATDWLSVNQMMFPTDGSDFTIDFWFKISSIASNTYYNLLHQRLDTNNRLHLVFDNRNAPLDRGISFDIRSGGTFYNISQSSGDSSDYSTGTWYHVAIVCDSGTWRLFVDGVQQSNTTTVTNIPNFTQPLYIGHNTDGADGVDFPGEIDELRISSVARWTGTGNFTPPTSAYTT